MDNFPWSNEELTIIRRLDKEVAQLIREYSSGNFIPTVDNLAEYRLQVNKRLTAVSAIDDEFWRHHFTSCMESLLYGIDLDCLVPYNFLGSPSNRLHALAISDPRSAFVRTQEILPILQGLLPMIDAVEEMLPKTPELGKSMIAHVLKTFFKNVNYALEVAELCGNDALLSDVKGTGQRVKARASELEQMVAYIPLVELPTLQMPFEYAVEKGMQADMKDILSWVDEDVEMRRQEFFRMAKEIDPNRDAYDLMANGSIKYGSVEEMFADTRQLIDCGREAALNFVNLPEGESVEMGETPEAWWAFCPTAMYSSISPKIKALRGRVYLNTQNLVGFSRANIEETLAHELYPGHHTHAMKAQVRKLGHTFGLSGLWRNRALAEGLCHRSEFVMIPHYSDPISKLEAARRGWYCATRVKAEVSLYYERKGPAALIDNYVRNLMCTTYAATAQTQAHMMRPADGISYYTGMRFLEKLYHRSGKGMKEFTDETFNYGEMSLSTMERLLALPEAKKEQLQTLRDD